MTISKIIHSIFVFLALTSCVTNDYFETKQLIEPSLSLSETMATEVVTTLKNQTPPAKTTISFTHKDEPLSLLIEKMLREEGFALTTKEGKPASRPLVFAYTLTPGAEEGQIFLRFVLGESFQATRAYELSTNGKYRSLGPLLLRRDEP